jgi:hypothetical protein
MAFRLKAEATESNNELSVKQKEARGFRLQAEA